MNEVIAFWILSAIAVLGALVAVQRRNLIHGVFALMIFFAAQAGLFLLLLAEFIAAVQILVYIGAVGILLLFAIMLTRGSEYPRISDNRQWPLAAVAAVGVAATLGISFWKGGPGSSSGPQNPIFSDLATSLFTRWAIPFEVASLVLLVALIGAIIIARGGGENS